MYDFILASYSNFIVIVRFLRERHNGCKSLFVVSQPCLPPFVRAIASEFRHCFAQKLKVDVTDMTVVPANYGHDRRVAYTPQIHYRHDRRVHDGRVCYGHDRRKMPTHTNQTTTTNQP